MDIANLVKFILPKYRFKFYIDRMDSTRLSGWIWEPGKPRSRVELTILIDGVAIHCFTANRFRLDLENAKMSDGNCSFDEELSSVVPAKYVDGKGHILTLKEASTGSVLAKAPNCVFGRQTQPSTNSLQKTEGFLSPITVPYVDGWILHDLLTYPEFRVALEIDGDVICTKTPNRLVETKTGMPTSNNRIGFRFVIPAKYLDGQVHCVVVRDSLSRKAIANTPQYFSSNRYSYKSYLQGVKNLVVSGWVYNEGATDERVDLAIVVNCNNTFHTKADLYRADLHKKGFGDGIHGFEFAIPPDIVNADVKNNIEVVTVVGEKIVAGRNEFVPSAQEIETAKKKIEAEIRHVQKTPRNFERISNSFDYPSSINFILEAEQQQTSSDVVAPPLVSVVMPVWNRKTEVVNAIKSVISQSYNNWELIIVDDGSDDGTAQTIARNFVDDRITLVELDHVGVSAARNEGLERSKGKYVAYLDSDNVWEPFYLRTMVSFIEGGGYSCIYCAMKLERESGIFYRGTPFNFNALLEQNYIDINVFMHKKSLVETRGGFDTELKRMVDWDLIIRFCKDNDVGYAPFVGVLYDDKANRPRITRNEYAAYGHVVVNKNLIDWDALSQPSRPRVKGLVSIIVPVLNNILMTEQMVYSIYANSADTNFEIVIVNNGSNPETKQRLFYLSERFGNLKVINSRTNYGFAIGCNLGAANALGEFLLFLNNDTLATPGFLNDIITPMQDETIRGVQPKLLYSDGTVQCAGLYFNRFSSLPTHLFQYLDGNDPVVNKPRRLSAVTAACVAVRAAEFYDVHGFDALYVNGSEDVDLCLRMKEKFGGDFLYEPATTVYHLESQSKGRHDTINQNRRIFVERWQGKTPIDDEMVFSEEGLLCVGYKNDETDPLRRKLSLAKPVWIMAEPFAQNLKHILVIKPSGIGNMVMFLPALEALKSLYPAASITILCFAAEAGLVRSIVDDVIVIAKDPESGMADPAEAASKIKDGQFDLALYPPFTNIGGPTAELKQKVRFHIVHPHIDYSAKHEIEHNLDLIRMLGWRGASTAPVFTPEISVPENQLPEKFIAIHMGSSSTLHMQKKRWPIRYWVEVVEALAETNQIVFVGGPGEEAHFEEIYALLSKESRRSVHDNISHHPSLMETAVVLSQASLVLSNDSGLMHLAAALDVNVIAVFGPTSAVKNGPSARTAITHVLQAEVECGPCFANRFMLIDCTDQICLSQVTSTSMLNAIQKIEFGPKTAQLGNIA